MDVFLFENDPVMSEQEPILLICPAFFQGLHATYRVLGELGRGGRGKTYHAEISKSDTENPDMQIGRRVVVKTIAIDQFRGSGAVRRFVNRVNTLLEHEFAALTKLRGLACVAQCFDTGIWEAPLPDKIATHPRFIIQEFIEGKGFDEYLKAKFSADDDEFHGLPSPDLWFEYAFQLCEGLNMVHQRGVIHADIWPKNIIVRGKEFVYIDFGEAVFRAEKDPFYAPEWSRTDQYVAPEWRIRSRTSSRRGDIYSLGGVFYYLATGEAPPSKTDDERGSTKNRIEQLLNDKCPALINANPGIADIIARCLRPNRERRVSNAEALFRELNMFSAPEVTFDPIKIAGQIQSRLVDTQMSSVFERMAGVFLRRLDRTIEDLTNGVLDLNAERNVLAASMCELLATLEVGDEYLEISTPEFWIGNIGVSSRFVTMNHLCVLRGVQIRRLLVFDDSDLSRLEIGGLVESQLNLLSVFTKSGRENIEIRCLSVTSDEKYQMVDHGQHGGIILSGDQATTYLPRYDDSGAMTLIRIRLEDAEPDHLRERQFGKYWDRGETLTSTEPTWLWNGIAASEPESPNV